MRTFAQDLGVWVAIAALVMVLLLVIAVTLVLAWLMRD